VVWGKLQTGSPREECTGLSPAARQAVSGNLTRSNDRARQGSRDPFAVNRAGNPASDDERTEAVVGVADVKPRTPCPVPLAAPAAGGTVFERTEGGA